MDQVTTALFPIALILWTVLLAYLIINLIGRGRRMRSREVGNDTNANPWWVLVVFLVVLALGLGLLLYSGAGGNGTPFQQGDGGNGDGTPTDPSTEPAAPVVSLWSGAGLALIGAVILFLAFRSLYHRRPFQPKIPSTQGKNDQAMVVKGAMNDIVGTTGDELRDAIIRAYHAMCLLLPADSLEVDALTPREFEERAIVTLGWPAAPVRDLTWIFELARYSHHPITVDDRGRAMSSLEMIRISLVEGVTVPAIAP
jgi:hypothetical protein